MKTINKTVSLLIMTLVVVGSFLSCKKEDLPNGGKPRIQYVRITNPASADSLLIGAGQGNLIAIMGENLGKARDMWFNDQKASLNPTYVTNTSILVHIPTPIPVEINNKLKIVFSNGDSLLYDFQVQISKPLVKNMVCEFVNEGDVATIRGDFFYEPLTVTFAGGVTGELVSVKDQEIQVRIPAGAQSGPITVKTNFGETESDFWFRDNRNIFISSDPFEGWHDPQWVVSNPGPGDPAKINGNYIHVKAKLGAWSYNEIADGDAGSMPHHSKNIPDAAILNPKDYNLKFEINTVKPYNSSQIRINAGTSVQDNGAYIWNPPYDSKGQWQTVVIPYEEVVASYAVKPTVNPNGYWTMLLIQGPGDFDADICFDNFRVVPKVNK
jgi:Surface glycan-binding protein B xyloglucan binding domain